MYTSLLVHCYRSYRDQIEHEDLLLNQRVTWIVTSQAFLLGTYVFLMNSPSFYMLTSSAVPTSQPGGSTNSFDAALFLYGVNLLRRVFQVVGLSSSIATCVSSMAAVLAIGRLMREYGRHLVLLDRPEHAREGNTPRDLSPAEIFAAARDIHQREGLPPLVTRRRYRVMGLAASVFFGVVFAAAWSVLIFPLRYLMATVVIGLVFGLLAMATGTLWHRASCIIRTRWFDPSPLHHQNQ